MEPEQAAEILHFSAQDFHWQIFPAPNGNIDKFRTRAKTAQPLARKKKATNI
ncbi:hypothetical protein [Devosia geojensis]|uniref:hypothetical protein n=1 Tax=Devosia geojensis TaxID=443610 RepID=UPI001364DF80|nr:hypothetical protein [Devosia geojensis]